MEHLPSKIACHTLIIEDDWLIAEYLADIAERAGVTSLAIAYTEAEALLAAHRQVPDVILSDVNLGDGRGPHAVRAIRSSLGAIPVIFITANPDACEPFPKDSVVLCKPVSPSTLISAIHSVR